MNARALSPSRLSFFLIGTLLLFASSTQAVTIHVPGGQPTIQAGINAASTGDTVLVACGTYFEYDIVMQSGICLLSETGEAACVTIDAQRDFEQRGRVLYCENLNTSTLIRGFTLTGGWLGGEDGAGVFCGDHSSPTIESCTIRDNGLLGGRGGGVYCGDHSSPTIESCTIRDNYVSFGNGGGMFCTNHSSPTLTGVTFEGNVSSARHGPGSGGGLSCQESSSPRLADCAFIANGGYGGGMLCYSGSPVLERVIFESNASLDAGAAMDCTGGTATLIDVVISRNQATGHGAALSLAGCTAATLTRVTFDGNSEVAALFTECSPTVTSCTLYGNDDSVTCAGGASPALERTIIAFNTRGPAIYCVDPSSQPVVECCDIYGNAGGDWVGCIADQHGINGNISEDPLFCEAAGGDYTIHADSPCAPANSGGCGLIGALPVGCGVAAVEPTTWGAIKAQYR